MTEKDKSGIRILVVDDDQKLLTLLDDTLTTIGYTTSTVLSANEALFKLSKRVYDLVITDIDMPEMDGFELLNKIRNSYPRLPVIFITGVAKLDMIGRANPEGFLAKPFRISNLEELIDKTLSGKEEKLEIKHRRILVIDDDENFREMLIEALKVCDYSAIPASNPKEALETLERVKVDAVVTDIKMPVMDGVSLARTIKDRHPYLPVILITAYHFFENYTYDEQNKMADGILQKPFGLELILDLLKKVIRTPDKSPV
ncbi:MAG: response regulator [Candidatus Zixiibacteriota bacterium]